TAQEEIGTAVAAGGFRRDLFQRLAGVVITLPPLAARLEDVIPLAEHFAEARGQRLDIGVKRVLLDYSWPGNVRELRLVIERAGELMHNGTVASRAVIEAIALGTTGAAISRHSSQSAVWFTREEVLTVLRTNEWDVQRE